MVYSTRSTAASLQAKKLTCTKRQMAKKVGDCAPRSTNLDVRSRALVGCSDHVLPPLPPAVLPPSSRERVYTGSLSLAQRSLLRSVSERDEEKWPGPCSEGASTKANLECCITTYTSHCGERPRPCGEGLQDVDLSFQRSGQVRNLDTPENRYRYIYMHTPDRPST